MRRTSLVTAAACAAAVLALTAPAAQAAGKVEQGPQNAKSICSYSGLNDDPSAPYPEGGRVQSFGQLVAQGVFDAKDVIGTEHPGTLCNPNNLPLK